MTSGTGKGTTARERGAEGQLVSILQNVEQQTAPVRTELGQQIQEALTTGGVGAQIPIISAAQQQSRQATSSAIRGLTEDVARSGLARTPFAARALGETRLAGEQATGLIPSQIASQFIGMAPSFAFAGLGPEVSGYSTLAGLGAQRDIAKGQNPARLLGGLTSMGGQAGGAALGAAFT